MSISLGGGFLSGRSLVGRLFMCDAGRGAFNLGKKRQEAYDQMVCAWRSECLADSTVRAPVENGSALHKINSESKS